MHSGLCYAERPGLGSPSGGQEADLRSSQYDMLRCGKKILEFIFYFILCKL